MKAFVHLVVAVTLTVPLVAQTVPKTKTKQKATAATAEDIRALRDALAAQSSALADQQQQIQQLQQSLAQRDQAVQAAQQQAQEAQATAADTSQKVAAAASVSADKDSVAKLNSDLTDVKTTVQNQLLTAQDEQKRVSALEGVFGRFRWTGDVRVRGENFDQTGMADRNRARIRVRFGFEGKLNEDLLSGIALATGSLGDPDSTNETMTNNFDRKTIALDKGWITYNPVAHRWLSLTAGKFAYPWQRTSLTLDPDLSPEGFDEKLSFDIHQVPGVQNLPFKPCNCSTTKLRVRAACFTATIRSPWEGRLRRG
jgi:hypothetical protein